MLSFPPFTVLHPIRSHCTILFLLPVAEPTCDTKVRKVRVQRDKELEDALFDGEEEMAQKRLERDKEIEGKFFRGSWVGQVGPVDSWKGQKY